MNAVRYEQPFRLNLPSSFFDCGYQAVLFLDRDGPVIFAYQVNRWYLSPSGRFGFCCEGLLEIIVSFSSFKRCVNGTLMGKGKCLAWRGVKFGGVMSKDT
jgi:hypothetical protein